MAILRLALAQFDFPVGAIAANADRVRALMREARAGGANLLVCPELALSGYPPEDLLLRPSFLAACQSEMDRLAAESDGVAALVGFPHSEGVVYNAAAWLRDGRVAQVAHKCVLPNYGVFDDKRWFEPGHAAAVTMLDGVRVGVLICEDVWQPEPAAAAARAGAELIVVINASPFDTAKQLQREAVLATRAKETGCAMAYVNMVGGQDDVVYDGASLLVNGDGATAARAPAFVDVLLWAEFDSASRKWTARDWPVAADGSSEATLYAALVRGVRDYVRKNGFDGVLLGLSGGIDSALTLAIAVDALGADKVGAVMLPSRYTSELSLREAHAQAQTLGVEYFDLPIGATVDAAAATLAPACGELADLTAQNLQARARGVLLMALSNQTGKLLLTTGNKSEMAVGYATLYGDMCGGYAPLKDVYKMQVYALAKWRNGAGNGESGIVNREARQPVSERSARSADAGTIPDSRFPIPVAVIERAPSAELRADQTDQDSLPPYDVLDGILQRCIEGAESQAEIVAAGYDAEDVQRVVRMLYASEFKRRQAAPGPRVSSCAFGRERRYPISNAWR
ncbi:MAG: NAD synthetase / Glutamine amidotransferase chain of NAD synthetase [Rhodanobacteraceae bacterium]|jgi:NAD+ synthase (glutamine-hydrolysing)|nr:MAG: NAD synthetase / Glutamine amidotransferase chain of NAD synthetase [Rhodanobacteraceae bacterium]